MTDVIHCRVCYCEYLWKMSHLIFPHWSIMNCPDLMSPISQIRDVQVVDSYGLITSCNLQSAQSSSLALTLFAVVSKLQKGDVRIGHSNSLGDLTFQGRRSLLAHNVSKGWGNSYAKFRGAARLGFPASTKNLLGADIRSPSVHVIKLKVKFTHWIEKLGPPDSDPVYIRPRSPLCDRSSQVYAAGQINDFHQSCIPHEVWLSASTWP